MRELQLSEGILKRLPKWVANHNLGNLTWIARNLTLTSLERTEIISALVSEKDKSQSMLDKLNWHLVEVEKIRKELLE